MEEIEEYVTIFQAACLLGISANTIKKAIASGELPAHRYFPDTPGFVEILKRDLDIWNVTRLALVTHEQDPKERSEEYLPVMKAALRVGVSDRTIMRAIYDGKLNARYPYPDRPSFAEISVADLDTWHATLHVRHGETQDRLETLETQVTEITKHVMAMEIQTQVLSEVYSELGKDLADGLELGNKINDNLIDDYRKHKEAIKKLEELAQDLGQDQIEITDDITRLSDDLNRQVLYHARHHHDAIQEIEARIAELLQDQHKITSTIQEQKEQNTNVKHGIIYRINGLEDQLIGLQKVLTPYQLNKKLKEVDVLARHTHQLQSMIHKQADDHAKQIAELKKEIQDLKHQTKIEEAPTETEEPLPKGFTLLSTFADLHNIPYDVPERLFKKGMIHGQRTGESKRNSPIAIGARGQHDFWEHLHIDARFHACDDCPHFFEDIAKRLRIAN